MEEIRHFVCLSAVRFVGSLHEKFSILVIREDWPMVVGYIRSYLEFVGELGVVHFC